MPVHRLQHSIYAKNMYNYAIQIYRAIAASLALLPSDGLGFVIGVLGALETNFTRDCELHWELAALPCG